MGNFRIFLNPILNGGYSLDIMVKFEKKTLSFTSGNGLMLGCSQNNEPMKHPANGAHYLELEGPLF